MKLDNLKVGWQMKVGHFNRVWNLYSFKSSVIWEFFELRSTMGKRGMERDLIALESPLELKYHLAFVLLVLKCA